MKNQQKAGILLNYANEAVKILSVLLYTPVLLRLLGQAEYGLYQMVTAVVSNLGLLSFGFGSAYVRFHSRYRLAGDKLGEARLNGMFLLIFAGLSTVCLLCGGWLVKNAGLVFGSGLTGEELTRAKGLLAVLVGNLSLTLLGSVFDCCVGAREQFGFQNGLRLAQSILSPFITMPLLLLDYGSLAVAAVSAALTLAALGTNVYYCWKKLAMGFSFRGLEFGLLKELWAFTFFLFLNQLMDQLNWSVDRFLLGRMCGTASVAVYGIGGQINTLYMQLSTAICAVFVPKIHRLVSRGGQDSLNRIMVQVGRLQLRILLLVLTGFLFFGRAFLRLWAGEAYGESYRVALLLMLPMTVPLIQNLGIEIQRAKNKHQTRSIVYACLAIGNVVLSIFLIRLWGCSGAAAGTAITQVLGTGVFMNWYYHRKIGLDMMAFWKEMMSCVRPLLPVFLLGSGYGAWVRIETWQGLMASILLYTLVYGAVLWHWGLGDGEKALLFPGRKKEGQAQPPVPPGNLTLP